MAQQNEVRGRSTAIFTDETGMTRIIYHNTAVVSFDNDKIVLNTGGYKTSTTKTRMNQAANQFRLGFSVIQKDFDWYVTYNGEKIPFTGSTLTLERN